MTMTFCEHALRKERSWKIPVQQRECYPFTFVPDRIINMNVLNALKWQPQKN